MKPDRQEEKLNHRSGPIAKVRAPILSFFEDDLRQRRPRSERECATVATKRTPLFEVSLEILRYKAFRSLPLMIRQN